MKICTCESVCCAGSKTNANKTTITKEIVGFRNLYEFFPYSSNMYRFQLLYLMCLRQHLQIYLGRCVNNGCIMHQRGRKAHVCIELVMTTTQNAFCCPWHMNRREIRESTARNYGVRRTGSNVHKKNRQERRRSVTRNEQKGKKRKREEV